MEHRPHRTAVERLFAPRQGVEPPKNRPEPRSDDSFTRSEIALGVNVAAACGYEWKCANWCRTAALVRLQRRCQPRRHCESRTCVGSTSLRVHAEDTCGSGGEHASRSATRGLFAHCSARMPCHGRRLQAIGMSARVLRACTPFSQVNNPLETSCDATRFLPTLWAVHVSPPPPHRRRPGSPGKARTSSSSAAPSRWPWLTHLAANSPRRNAARAE